MLRGMKPRRVQLSISIAPEDLQFLEQLSIQRGSAGLSEVLRSLIGGSRGLFELPAYQAKRLREDMESRGLDILAYLKETLALRYEELSRPDSAATSAVRAANGSRR